MSEQDFHDIAEAILSAKGGSSKAYEWLITRYYVHIRRSAAGFSFAGADRDDVIQEATIGFCSAVQSFDTTGDVPFEAYFTICIKRHLIDASKKALRNKHKPLNTYISLNTAAGTSCDHVFKDFGFNSTFDPTDAIIDREAVQLTYERFKAALSPFERQVLDLYLEGKSYSTIGEVLSKSPKSVDNAVQRIRRKLSALLPDGSVK